ncbi:Adaptor for signal transduction [Mortierella alpina]|uniref:Adaptor for signal transduction n=1 Tax=Mortierella alpina TaxID=64518 RepID=A0A9P6J4V6_MORAP|nr:Adaptor for signal transduction [Mortierella alpina]
MESITQWDSSRVHQWMCSIGFPNYEKQIKDNGISGDLLVHLDHAALKDLSIWEVGKRLLILKAIYQLKISYGISLEAGDYVPPSVAFENEYNYQAAASLKSVEQAVHEKDNTIQHLVREVERMSKDLTKLKDELWIMQKDQKPLPEPSPGYPKSMNGQSSSLLSASQTSLASSSTLAPQSPIHATHNINSARSPIYGTDSGFHSVPSSPHSPADTRVRGVNPDTNEDGKAIASPGVDGAGAIKVYGQKPSTRDPVDAFRSFRISQDDPCYKVLPAALKKYKINDDWRQYALFICYGNTERILTYNEKPLLLMKQLKENKESPVFMLKHIKQMKSPAVNAPSPPNSHPPRKSSDIMNKELPMPPESMAGSSLTVGSGSSLGVGLGGGSGINGSSHMNGHGTSNGASLVRSGTSASMRTSSKGATAGLGASSSSNINGSHAKSESSSSNSSTLVGPKPENYVQETVEASGTAVALYEWEAKRDDELNVKVGDVFKIKSKGHGWWVVQRDDEIGWIPASILSESNSEDGYFSAEGVAIFDFAKTGPNELSIKTGDKLLKPALAVTGKLRQVMQMASTAASLSALASI